MERNEVAEIIQNYFNENEAVNIFGLSIVLGKLFTDNPGMEECMDRIEETDGRDGANRWLAHVLSQTEKYELDETGEYVTPMKQIEVGKDTRSIIRDIRDYWRKQREK